jgi:hypothetical protein
MGDVIGVQQIVVRKSQSVSNIYRIEIDNIGCMPNGFQQINRILKNYAKGSELFLGCYKIDGTALTKKELLEYSMTIPEFFQRYGRYHPIDVTVKKREKEKQLQNELTVYSILNNDVNRDILTKIFQYHLETVLFCPKLELENFILFYKDYMNNTWEDYIKKGFTDILFTYADSGDFSVIFRTDIYEQEQLFTEINEIILDS